MTLNKDETNGRFAQGGKHYKRQKGDSYPTAIRKFADMDVALIRLYAMRWGLIKQTKLADEKEGWDSIPKTFTVVQKAALIQTWAALKYEDSRKEWADRAWGKAAQTNLNVEASTNLTREEMFDALDDKLGGIMDHMKEDK